jgi:GNAT superfamily N-acetyltransferase
LRTKTNRELAWDTLSDADAAAALMRASWSENRERPLDYDAELLGRFLAYPGSGPIIAPALYDEDRLAAFVMGMPRQASCGGETRRLLLMTFFTVAPEWKGHGLGVAVWAECLRRAREAGYDGAIHYCVEGNVSNHVTRAGARAAGLEARPIGAVRYLMRLLEPAPGSAEMARADVDDFVQAAASAAREAPLARLWTGAEAAWQCRDRVDPVCVTRRRGASAGALAGDRIRSLDEARTRSAFIDDVLWHELAPEDRACLLQEFVREASADAEIVVVPMLDYADLAPFRAAGFRRSRRTLNGYLTMWNGDADVDVSSIYMDVL